MIDVFDQIFGYVDDRIETAVIDDARDIFQFGICAMDDGRTAHGDAVQVDLRIIVHLIDQIDPFGDIALIVFGEAQILAFRLAVCTVIE